jgi:glycosyltransferase involved in cell wall biosynthesis
MAGGWNQPDLAGPHRTDGQNTRADGGNAVHALLDISRLLLSLHRTTPSGIDRVEMAYARRWLAAPPDTCTFVAENLWGRFAALPRSTVAGFVAALGACWQHGPQAAAGRRRAMRSAARMQADLAMGRGRAALAAALERHRGRCAFLLVSHRALDRADAIAALHAAGAAFVPLLHDVIPLSHPEYTRPSQVGRHARRLATVAALADGVLVNSAATEAAVRAHLPWHGAAHSPAIAVAPLGIDATAAQAPQPMLADAAQRARGDDPYFVMLGTIEPRKNHLLMLHLWRALAAEGTPPRLVIIGRRGWANAPVLDLLDRCAALRHGLVQEAGALPDAAVAPLLAGARALLFPSFAEGYGLPVAEALAAGLPVLCSDLPALREVAGGVADMLDPTDGPAWRQAVRDYADPASPRRAAQHRRMAAWRPPHWDAHFTAAETLLDRALSRRSAAARLRDRRPQGADPAWPPRRDAPPALAGAADPASA